jgi:indole-3-acetate monooxygenase
MKHVIDEALVAKARALGPLIRESAAEGERERQLLPQVVSALERGGFTKMFLPQSLGGLETDPLTAMRVVEEIASFDSSAGWLLMVGNSGAWFPSRLPRETVEKMFLDQERTHSATAFQPPVEAREVPGGYRLTGRRPLASGAHSARWACLTALVMEGNAPKMVNGMPVAIVAIMDIKDVEIVDTWHGLGLRASDSSDLAVRDLFVPQSFTCLMSPVFEPNDHYRGPLYRLPAMAPLILATLAPTALAVARRAIDEVRALSSKRMPMGSTVVIRDRGAAQARLGRAEGMLRAARAYMYEAMEEAWDRTVRGEPSTLQQKADVLLAATHVAQTAAQVTNDMFTSGGSSAVYTSHPLERLFRDANVIRQHGFVAEGRFETFAQVFLGLEPDLPVLHF